MGGKTKIHEARVVLCRKLLKNMKEWGREEEVAQE